MDEKIAYTLSVLLGAVALVLLVANVSLVNGNRHLQEDVSRRQAMITAGANLSQLNQSLVQALADATVKDNDSEIRELLASQNITVKANPAKTPVSAPAPAPAAKTK